MALGTKLRKIANHPAHYRGDVPQGNLAEQSGKLAKLDELVTEITQAGEAVLVFTQFVEMGQVNKDTRASWVKTFQSGAEDAPSVFIISTKAGGTGLTLTRANHVIQYDLWWNPAVLDQADARAHRIGQTKPVHIHRLISQGTIEDKISDILTDKTALAENLLDNLQGNAGTLTDDDRFTELLAEHLTTTTNSPTPQALPTPHTDTETPGASTTTPGMLNAPPTPTPATPEQPPRLRQRRKKKTTIDSVINPPPGRRVTRSSRLQEPTATPPDPQVAVGEPVSAEVMDPVAVFEAMLALPATHHVPVATLADLLTRLVHHVLSRAADGTVLSPQEVTALIHGPGHEPGPHEEHYIRGLLQATALPHTGRTGLLSARLMGQFTEAVHTELTAGRQPDTMALLSTLLAPNTPTPQMLAQAQGWLDATALPHTPGLPQALITAARHLASAQPGHFQAVNAITTTLLHTNQATAFQRQAIEHWLNAPATGQPATSPVQAFRRMLQAPVPPPLTSRSTIADVLTRLIHYTLTLAQDDTVLESWRIRPPRRHPHPAGQQDPAPAHPARHTTHPPHARPGPGLAPRHGTAPHPRTPHRTHHRRPPHPHPPQRPRHRRRRHRRPPPRHTPHHPHPDHRHPPMAHHTPHNNRPPQPTTPTTPQTHPHRRRHTTHHPRPTPPHQTPQTGRPRHPASPAAAVLSECGRVRFSARRSARLHRTPGGPRPCAEVTDGRHTLAAGREAEENHGEERDRA